METTRHMTKTKTQRIQRLIERHLRLRAKGIERFEQSRAALHKAMNAGLAIGEPVDIPGSGTYALVDNFAGEKTGGYATVSRFDLKKATKKQLAPAPATEAAV